MPDHLRNTPLFIDYVRSRPGPAVMHFADGAHTVKPSFKISTLLIYTQSTTSNFSIHFRIINQSGRISSFTEINLSLDISLLLDGFMTHLHV